MADARANILITAEDRTKAAFDSVARSFENIKRIAVTAFAAEGLKAVVEAGRAAEQSANRLTAAYRSQSAQVGLTRKQLDELADSMAAATQFNDNDFKKGEAELLKFGNIYGDVFVRATKLSADLAAFNGGDLVSSFDAIGKALANPVDGLKSLGREIGRLLPAQIEHVKNLVQQNKGLEAQNYILDLVQKHIGGTADLMNSGYTKAIEDTAKAWDKFKEALANIVVIKDTVISALNAIAGSLRGIASIFQGGSFSEGVLGKQGALAKQITDLQDQLAAVEGRKGLTFTDDEGRVIGEDLRADELRKKIADLTAEYKKLYQTQAEGAAKAAKPIFGMTAEQLAFIKDIERQQGSVGQGPEGALFAKAGELGLGSKGLTSPYTKTEQKIVALSQALQDLNDEKERGSRRAAGGRAELQFDENVADQIKQLELEQKFIGATADEQKKWTAIQQLDNEVRKVSLQMLPDQAAAFEELAAVLKNKVGKAYDELFAKQHAFNSGVKTGLIDVFQTASDSAAQARNLVVDSFKSMEDALVSFVKTGKIDFRSLADSIITEIIRIRIQQSIIAPLASSAGTSSILSTILGGLTGAGSSTTPTGSTAPTFNDSMYIEAPVGHRAGGGSVAANQPYWVGEQGPELFMPNTGGSIVANGRAGGTFFIDARGADSAGMARLEGMIRQLGGSIEPRAVAAVAQARQRGAAGLR